MGHVKIYAGNMCRELVGNKFELLKGHVKVLVEWEILPSRHLFYTVLLFKMYK